MFLACLLASLQLSRAVKQLEEVQCARAEGLGGKAAGEGGGDSGEAATARRSALSAGGSRAWLAQRESQVRRRFPAGVCWVGCSRAPCNVVSLP